MRFSAFSWLKGRWGKWTIILIVVVVAVVGFGVYLNAAFPRIRCEGGKHLDSPEALADCYGCHTKATPKVAQDWHESKHGIMLVKCFVCHGEPDGKGAIAFAKTPDVNLTCIRCHDSSIKMMAQKYGLEPSCVQCHPFHQNSLHHAAFVKPVSKKEIE